ncbi:MAG: BCD family MFS transporter [Pseudomonadota bacterium]
MSPTTTPQTESGLSWFSIFRLGLVQAALGSIVVLTTSTLNRVMVVELGLLAVVPGALVGWHYAVQILRPLWGHRSDIGGNRSLWIIGGIAVLALSGTGAAASALVLEQNFVLGIVAAIAAYTFIGFGIGAAGTSLLALMASRTAPQRRPAAATIVWLMMIAGIAVTAIITGQFLDPYSHSRLVAIAAIAGAISLLIAIAALFGIERKPALRAAVDDGHSARKPPFLQSLRATMDDPAARLFTVFVFVSMLAYSTQDLILEPYGGFLFAMTPGETTSLSGLQHGGVFIGMLFVGIFGSLLARRWPGILRFFIVGGCLASGLALALLSMSASFAPNWPLTANIVFLGLANGAFAVAAIGCMMTLAGADGKKQEGIRMGLWGAAQAIAFGLGGVMGTIAIDLARAATNDIALSYAIVFAAEAVLFVISAVIASQIVFSQSRAQTDWAPGQTPYQT